MAPEQASRKRKARTTDSVASEEAALYDELGNGLLAGSLSDGEEDIDSQGSSESDLSEGSWATDEEDDEALHSDEIPSEDEDATHTKLNGTSSMVDGDESIEDELAARSSNLRQEPQITTDANGNLRYVYAEIDPVYDSDDSDAPADTAGNTIGNIPLSFYDAYPHIGYDLDGKRVMRPAKGKALDSLLDSIDIPKGWTGLTDPATGKPLELNEEELDVLKKLTRNEIPEEGYDPYPPMVEYFSSRVEQMPLSAAPEPKRRFVPSKHEAKRVMKIVKAIKEGRIQPYRPPEEREAEEDPEIIKYDVWADEAPRPDHPMNVPAPKLPPPGYDESYHPPPEYLPDADEKKAWEEADEEDREKDYLPANYSALRKVPGYARFVKERFYRVLDLYLAPRVRRSKLNIDPESLLPKLPSPEELKPFPSRCEMVLEQQKGRVRTLAVDPLGNILASGGDDGFVRLWSLHDGRQVWSVQLSTQDPINVVRWRPSKDSFVFAACAGEIVYFVAPDLPSLCGLDGAGIQAGRDILNAGWTVQAAKTDASSKENPGKWARPPTSLQSRGVLLQLTLRSTIKQLTFHRRGDYFATVSPAGQNQAVSIHTLSKHLSQLPFRRLKGLPQSAAFHPSKPVFFVATQRSIRSYDLSKQELIKTLQPGARWISGFDVHRGGDNIIVGSYDKRLLWMDLDLSSRPYKTLRYHGKAIRCTRFHGTGSGNVAGSGGGAYYPLFADTSDDGTVQVFHGKVVGDLMENATIVPLKVLRGHKVVDGLGVLELDWHPNEPWCVSAGADGTCRVWRP